MHASERALSGPNSLAVLAFSRSLTREAQIAPTVHHDRRCPISRRMKITLPDPLLAQLQELTANIGEPVSRVATRMVSGGLA
jgi:hypothetical protein